jgi:hypothetical protein
VKQTLRVVVVAAALVALAACGKREQTVSQKKTDAKAWQGGDSAYSAAGWKAGDQKAWEEQLRTRAQGQNDYARAPAPSQP